MPVTRPRILARLVTVGTAALFVMCGALAVAAPASAHDSLTGADPAADSTVAEMPETVTLSFSAALLTMSPQDTIVDVVSPSGEDVSQGDAVVDGAVVRQAIGAVTEAGAYTVNWHVVSSDGHPTEGTYTFTVESAPAENGAAPVAPENDETATPPPPRSDVTPTPAKTSASPSPEPEESSFGDVLPWIVLGLAGVAVLGALVAVLVARARGDEHDEGADEDASDQD